MMLSRQYHAAELLGSEPRAFEAVIAVEYFKICESLSMIKLQQHSSRKRWKSTNGDKIVCYIWNKVNFLHQWKQSVIVPISDMIRMQI